LDPRRIVTSVTPVEIAAVLVLVVTAAAVALVYAYSVLPGQVRSAQLSSARSANAAKIDELRAKVLDPSAVRQEFDDAVASLERFRGEVLKPRLPGRVAIVRDVDRLTRATGVALIGGVTFSTSVAGESTPEDGESDSSERTSKSSKQATDDVGAYSSLKFSLSVSGRYDRLRKFIGEFEASPQFVVIDSINVVPSDGPSDAEDSRGRRVEAAPSDFLTLKINLTAYFQPQTGWQVAEDIASAEAGNSGA
jgi:hypothetical protein